MFLLIDDRRRFARGYMLWATVVCAILGIVFGYTDLSISVAVADSSRGWALAFQRWGELPGSVVVACAAFLLIGRDRSNEPANVRWGAPMLLIVLTTFLLNYMVHVLFERPRDGAEALAGSGPAWIGGCLLLCLIVPALVRQTRWSRDPRVQRFASLGVAHGAAVMLLILGLKELWGRVRFRDLSAGHWEFTVVRAKRSQRQQLVPIGAYGLRLVGVAADRAGARKIPYGCRRRHLGLGHGCRRQSCRRWGALRFRCHVRNVLRDRDIRDVVVW